MKILVSACLLGCNCRYNGEALESLDLEAFEVVPVCPEVLGGLPTPRPASEIVGDRVLSIEGRDVTQAFKDGAKKALDIMDKEAIKVALLKESSPSCGANFIYDGSFSGKKIGGAGIFARLLTERGLEVFSENQLDQLKARKNE